MGEIRVPKGLSREGCHRDVLRFPAITVKSALQMWASNYRTATTISSKPTGDGGSAMLNAPVAIPLPALSICATRNRQLGAIACPGPSRHPGTQRNNLGHDQAFDTRRNRPAVICSSHWPACGKPRGKSHQHRLAPIIPDLSASSEPHRCVHSELYALTPMGNCARRRAQCESTFPRKRAYLPLAGECPQLADGVVAISGRRNG